MKNQIKWISVFSSLSILSACMSSGPSRSSEGKSEAKSEAMPSEKVFQLRKFEEKTLENGLRVIYIQDSSLPRVSFHLMVLSGSVQDPRGQEGLTYLTTALLEQGSKRRRALQVADDFAQLGSSFTEMTGSDFVVLSTSGLSESKEQLLSIYSDVVLNPAFDASEVERKKSQTLAELKQLPDRPSEYTGVLFDQELFGSHPYGHPSFGFTSSLKAIGKKQIQSHYQTSFRPGNSILAITGNFDSTFRALVEKTFSSWKQGAGNKSAVVPIQSAQAKSIKLFSKSGLQQSQIRLGHFSIPRNHADFLKVRLANLILGGAFASRLNQKVRDDLGLTYSISSSLDARESMGSFEISTFARNEKVAEAIKATLQVVNDFHGKGVTEGELTAAKALLIGQFPAAIETVDKFALNLLSLRAYGVPDSYLTDFFANVNRIQLAEVNEAIRTHFHPNQMKVVIYADEKAVGEEIKSLGEVKTEKISP